MCQQKRAVRKSLEPFALVAIVCSVVLLVGFGLGAGPAGAAVVTPAPTATPANPGLPPGQATGLTPAPTSSAVVGEENQTPTPTATPNKAVVPTGGPTPIAEIDLRTVTATPTGTLTPPVAVPTGEAGVAPSPTLPAARTPFPYPDAIRGAYVAWAVPGQAIPPLRDAADPLAPGNHVLGLDCLTYLGPGGDPGIAESVWADEHRIDWTPFDRCIAAANEQAVKLPDGRVVPQPVALTLPSAFMDWGGSGVAADPYTVLHLPAWMQNARYTFDFQVNGHIYRGIRYTNPGAPDDFLARMKFFVSEAGKRYSDNPIVSLVRVYVGFQGESQPTRAQGGDAQEAVFQEHQKTVSCAEYQRFVRELAEAAYAAFPSKPVAAMIGVEPCAYLDETGTPRLESGESFRQQLYGETWAGAGKAIGLSINSIAPDRADADGVAGGSSQAWRKFAVGGTLAYRGVPVAFEWGDNPGGGAAAGEDRYQYHYWTMLSAAGAQGYFALPQWTWQPYWSELTWEINDYWFNGERRAWLVFRDREWPAFSWPTSGDGPGGMAGDYGKHLALLNPEAAPQVCAPRLRATAQASAAYWRAQGLAPTTPCAGEPLPTPVITPAPVATPGADTLNRLLDRQARRLDAAAQMAIQVSPEWAYYGGVYDVRVTLAYLDVGTDQFDVILAAAPERAYVFRVQKQGEGIWKRISWTTAAYLANPLPGSAFVQIRNDAGGPEYLHELFIDVTGEAAAAATPTPTP